MLWFWDITIITIIINTSFKVAHTRPVPIHNFNIRNLWLCLDIGRTPWTGEQPDVRPLPTQDNTTQKKTDTFMPRAGFETTIAVFNRSKTLRTLDRAAVGTDGLRQYQLNAHGWKRCSSSYCLPAIYMIPPHFLGMYLRQQTCHA
jgi:hypothetical protein